MQKKENCLDGREMSSRKVLGLYREFLRTGRQVYTKKREERKKKAKKA
jgi:hypothetical protein